MKKLLALVLALAMVFALCACGAKEEAPAVKEEPAKEAPAAEAPAAEAPAADGTHPEVTGKITVAQHRTDLEAEFAALIAAFNEVYPNVEVTVETVADYAKTMAVRIAGGETPDVVEVRDSMLPANTWPDYFASLEDCDLPDMLFKDYYTVDGVVYGACMDAQYRCMVYNKALYKEAGIESVPTTWDEFMAAMEKLSQLDGVIPLTSQYNTGWTQREWFDYYAASQHQPGWKDTFVDTDTPFSDEIAIRCADQYKQVIEAGYVEEDLMSSDWDLQSADFAAGTIGTYMGGNYIYATMVGLGMNPDDIGFYAFPDSEFNGGRCTLSGAVDWAWGMSKEVVGTENYEAACALVKFLAENYANFTNQLSAVIGAKSDIPAINEMLATDPIIVTESRVSDGFTAINSIAAINFGTYIQQYVIADDSSKVVDEYNATWAAARAEVKG